LNINLPEVDWTKQSNWTIESQLDKIREEFNEVIDAVRQGNPVEIIRESLDGMQTFKTLIEMVLAEWNVNGKVMSFERFQVEHAEKLQRKGYLKEGYDDKQR
jgi:Phosphoribosyl-ATP pyrophosphohydrolase.